MASPVKGYWRRDGKHMYGYKKNIVVCLMLLLVTLSCQNINTNNRNNSNNMDLPGSEMADRTPVNGTPPEMAIYEGKLLYVFFHPVIARPEIAFNGDRKEHFLDWFVTADEFKKILYELYIQDYILVDINEFYKITYNNGVKMITEQKLLVPKWKKPMVLSVDDLNYYDYMRENGIVHKLIIDEKNQIAAWTNNQNGGEISYDNDIITILENFIKEHPDFSLRGARGIIALTGFEGVLGYRTQRYENPGYQKEREKAVVVANKLKELGWRFASHSFTHWRLTKITFDKLMYDIKLWDTEVRPIIGDTDMYIYPFGAGLESYKDKHKALRDNGFSLFFGVGPGYKKIVTQEYIYVERINIDGSYLVAFKNRPDRLFDTDKIIDNKSRNIK